MNEISRKRREWVKTAAIVFLTVMLVLTFFSNTIMNYSLPEVAAQYVQSGSITAKIRGNGIVESGDPYNVMVKQTRKVMSVAVKAGTQVQKGDVILYLEDGDSEELKNALKALEAAQNAYDMALLTAEVDAGIISNAQSDISTGTYRQQINAAQTAVDKAQKEVDEWQEKYDDYTIQLTLTPSNGADITEETKAVNAAQKNLDDAKIALAAANNKVSELEARIDYLNSLNKGNENNNNADSGANNSSAGSSADGSVSGNEAADSADSSVSGNDGTGSVSGNGTTGGTGETVSGSDTTGGEGDVSDNDTTETELAKLQEELILAKKAQLDATESLNAAQLAYDKAVASLENKKATGDNSNTIKNLQEQQALMKVNLDAAVNALEERNKELTDLTGKINTTLTLQTLYDAVADARELVDEETSKTTDAVVTADIAGTIIQVNAVAGREVSAAEAVAIIQPEGQGYTMSFTVSNDQAKRLSVGDKAELINSWYYEDMDITLKSIRPDPNNPSQQKQLIFDVAGNVTAGQSVNVSVGQKSANYDYIVPNSAIREDSNGKFVLIVESKSSPLGNRYIATRADVEVLASDDTQSAVKGGLYGWEFVITTSTKPVEAGQQVRLSES